MEKRWKANMRVEIIYEDGVRESVEGDIKPYPWQRDYVLGRSNSLPIFSRSGKTMAVILYGLVRKIRYQDDIYKLAWQRDPDCKCRSSFETRCRQGWFYREYIGTALRAGLHKRPGRKGVNMR